MNRKKNTNPITRSNTVQNKQDKQHSSMHQTLIFIVTRIVFIDLFGDKLQHSKQKLVVAEKENKVNNKKRDIKLKNWKIIRKQMKLKYKKKKTEWYNLQNKEIYKKS